MDEEAAVLPRDRVHGGILTHPPCHQPPRPWIACAAGAQTVTKKGEMQCEE